MWWKKPKIEFLCDPRHFGAIAEPVAAHKALPDWYKRIMPRLPDKLSADNTGLTVKKCLPFLDAMSQGWIINTPGDIRVELLNNGTEARTGWNYPDPLIASHPSFQISGSPLSGKVILKFVTLWSVKTPPGYSCLFVPPLNRPSDFTIFSGIVDTDAYPPAVNVPFAFNRPDGTFMIEKGTPIVQVIPFRRETFKSEIRAMNPRECDIAATVERSIFSGEGWYRKFARAKR